MADGGNDIKRGRKFDQVLEGAREIFARDGFYGANVDEIARAAGVSKATLYSYFPDKRLLFMEVVRHECLRQAEAAESRIDMSLPVDQIIRQAVAEMLDLFLAPFNLRIYRLCVAEAERLPEVGQLFYDHGPALARQRIGDFLRAASASGVLSVPDADLAADQLVMLTKADLSDRLLLTGPQAVTQPQKDRVINGAVAMFMALYGPRP